MPVRIAVDAMGGDRAPAVVVDGAVRALSRTDHDLHVLLFGREAELRSELARHGTQGLALTVRDAADVITMQDAPAVAVKAKRQSSIHLGLSAVQAGQADAFVTAGNTGAAMAAAMFILGRVPGVARPTLAGYFPSLKGHTLLLDVGANVDCKPEHLLQFALMGQVFAERVMHRQGATVALMNIGEEPGKGNEAAKAAYELLRERLPDCFVGNTEGRDLLRHPADVVVSDGFVGNILLKFGESIATVLPEMIREQMHVQGLTDDEADIVRRVFGGVAQPFDYERYGGAPLLGVNGNVLIGHGGSTAAAIETLIAKGAEMVEEHVRDAIAETLARSSAEA